MILTPILSVCFYLLAKGTFGLQHNHQNSCKNSACLALGRHDADKNEIWDILFKDLENLRKTPQERPPGEQAPLYYSSEHRCMVEVFVDVTAVMQDRVERDKMCGLTTGKGKFAARWKWSANFDQLQDVLLPCELCEANLL